MRPTRGPNECPTGRCREHALCAPCVAARLTNLPHELLVIFTGAVEVTSTRYEPGTTVAEALRSC